MCLKSFRTFVTRTILPVPSMSQLPHYPRRTYFISSVSFIEFPLKVELPESK